MVFSHPARTQDTVLSTATDIHTCDDSASVHVVDVEKGVPSRAKALFSGGSSDIHSTLSEGHKPETGEIFSIREDFTEQQWLVTISYWFDTALYTFAACMIAHE
jgi:hypothetical protein